MEALRAWPTRMRRIRKLPLPASLTRLHREERGTSLVLIGLSLPILLGVAGLGVEVGSWYFVHERLQAAADTAALSAATSSATDGGNTPVATVQSQGKAVASSYSYTNGTGGTTVTVNYPPTTGSYISAANAVEVIIQQPQPRLFSALWATGTVPISARAVAVGESGTGCVLALNKTASGAISVSGSAAANLVNCNMLSNSTTTSLAVGNNASVAANAVYLAGSVTGASSVTATKGIKTNHAPFADPYASVEIPSFSGCDFNSPNYKTTATMSPGVYCNGATFTANAVVTMLPGVYYIDRGTWKMAGGAVVTGSDVTIVLTSSTGSNYAVLAIQGGANLNISGPTSGNFSGIAIFGDRRIAVGTDMDLAGGSGQNIGGAIYLPTANLNYTGGASLSTNCTQVIADTINFTGNTGLKVDCSSAGTQNLGTGKAKLVE
jgi:Flp pilus assembly protein TadG